MWSCINMQKIIKIIYISHLFILQIQSILESHFDQAHPTNFQSSFDLCEIVRAGKKSVPSFLYWDTVNFRVYRPDWSHLFLTMTHQKLFNQILFFLNLYQHEKNEVASSICSGKMIDLKLPQSEWLRAFWLISQE